MSLYVPEHFSTTDRVAIARLMHDYPFATLLSAGGGDPLVSHVPLVYLADAEPHGTLVGHVARSNRHWQHLDHTAVSAIFHGPHHYVSPSWYLEPETAVPTWNYAVVHAHGEAELIENRTETEGVLQLMIGRFESAMANPWSLSLTEELLSRMLAAIVAFRIRIRRFDAKFKLSQNRLAGDRRGVAEALRRVGSESSVELSEWMKRYGSA